jgi:hypothetical protein
MDFERIKEFLQTYLDIVIIPKLNEDREDENKVSLNVFQVVKGSYQPPIYHVFIDVEPPHTLRADLKKCETDIADFFKIFSINSKIKVHWNKRPIFKNDSLHSEN